MTRLAAFGLLLLMQALCALVFVLDILLSALGIYPAPLSWSTRELLEIGAGLGLFLGLILGTILVLRAVRDLNRAEARLDRASARLNAHVDHGTLDARVGHGSVQTVALTRPAFVHAVQLRR